MAFYSGRDHIFLSSPRSNRLFPTLPRMARQLGTLPLETKWMQKFYSHHRRLIMPRLRVRGASLLPPETNRCSQPMLGYMCSLNFMHLRRQGVNQISVVKNGKVNILLSAAIWKTTVRHISYLCRLLCLLCRLEAYTVGATKSRTDRRMSIGSCCSKRSDLCFETCVVRVVAVYCEPSTGSVITAISHSVSQACHSKYNIQMRNGWSFASAVLYAFLLRCLGVGVSPFFMLYRRQFFREACIYKEKQS